MCYGIEIIAVKELTGCVVFVCVLWYRNVSSVGLTGYFVFVYVLWYRNGSRQGADCECCVCVCVMVKKCEQ